MMSDKATFQEQQLVILAMAEGFMRKSDPAVPDDEVNLNELVALWSDLIPDTFEEMASHFMTACTMMGWMIWDAYEEPFDGVAFLRDRILAAEGGVLGAGLDDYDCDCGNCECDCGECE